MKPKQDLSKKAQETDTGSGGSQPPVDGKSRGTARPRVDSDSVSFRRSITLQLDADASPKWETVTEKNRGVWREILSHPKTVEALGLTPAAIPGPPEHCLHAKTVGALYNGLARFEALLCSWKFKVEFAEAVKLLAFTAEEKEQLTPVTQLLADKYIPLLADKYGLEFSLAVLLLPMLAVKVEAVRALKRKPGDGPVPGEAKDLPKEAIQ